MSELEGVYLSRYHSLLEEAKEIEEQGNDLIERGSRIIFTLSSPEILADEGKRREVEVTKDRWMADIRKWQERKRQNRMKTEKAPAV